MKIKHVRAVAERRLEITADDGRTGLFDLTPYLRSEAFAALRDDAAFQRVRSEGYFIEWECGADLSADTIEAHWQPGRVRDIFSSRTREAKPDRS